jgi:hypothetical protein
MLRDALASGREDPSKCPSVSRPCGTRTGSEMVIGFCISRWEGHWEAWEREWGGARWIWDVSVSGVWVSSRTS